MAKTASTLVLVLFMQFVWSLKLGAIEVCGVDQFEQKDRRARPESLSIYYRGGPSGVGPQEGRSEAPEAKDFERIIEAINVADSDILMLIGWNDCDFISQVLERIPNNTYKAYRIPIAEVRYSDRLQTKVNLTIFSKIDLINPPADSPDNSSSGMFVAECGWMAFVNLQLGNLKIKPVIIAPAQRLNAVSITERDCNADEAILTSFTNKITSMTDDKEQVVVFTDFSSGTQWNGPPGFNVQRGFIDFYKYILLSSGDHPVLSEIYEIRDPNAAGDLRYQTDSAIAPIVAPMFVSEGIKDDVTFVNRSVLLQDLPETLENMWLRSYGSVDSELRLDTAKWSGANIFSKIPRAWIAIVVLLLFVITFFSIRIFSRKTKKVV